MLQSATGAAIVAQNSGWQDLPISREDAASIIVRVMGQCSAEVRANIVVAQSPTAISNFEDVDSSTEQGQATDIAIVMVNNIMIGSNEQFGVGTSMKRGETCVIIQSLLNLNVLEAKNTTPSTTTPSTTQTAEEKQAEYVAEVFRLVNEERAKEGLSALIWHGTLMEAAQFKSDEMNDLGYYAHESPVYGGFNGIIELFNIKWTSCGENIARNSTPTAVMNAWMNSTGHRENILSTTFTHIGIGYANGYWTQQFIRS